MDDSLIDLKHSQVNIEQESDKFVVEKKDQEGKAISGGGWTLGLGPNPCNTPGWKDDGRWLFVEGIWTDGDGAISRRGMEVEGEVGPGTGNFVSIVCPTLIKFISHNFIFCWLWI